MKRQTQVNLVMTESEVDALNKAAESVGSSKSEFIRQAIRKAIKELES